MRYRADIDGLRAISVLIVLLFHAHLLKIKSGFIGVDIFFVISGFLITGNIVKALDKNNFSLIVFYKRRFLRLAPALLALLVAVFIMTFCFYLPDDLIKFIESATSLTFYNTNNYFAATTGGYFDSESNYLPLLHTWSLAIEWQWYALLPILLMVLYKILPRRWIPYSLIVLLISAIIWAMVSSSVGEITKHYYSLLARVFELLMGATLVFFPYDKIKLQRSVISTVGIIALIAILACIFESKVKLMFPNYYALLICLSASILIVIGQLDSQNLASRFLSLKPLVFIGLISYSLYLWHWPIFALIRYLDIEETLILKLLALALSFLLGYLSWKFIEQKTRYFASAPSIKVFGLLFVLPIGFVYGAMQITKANNGFYGRFDPELQTSAAIINQYKSVARNHCINNLESEGTPECYSGDKEYYTSRALVLGDSYANQYWNFIEVLAKDAHVLVESNTHPACLVLPDIYLYNWSYSVNKPHQACHDATQKQYDKVKQGGYQYVILGQVWSYYMEANIINELDDFYSRETSFERYKKALHQSIEMILKAGAKPIIFEETYRDELNRDNRCYLKSIKWRNNKIGDCGNPIVLDENGLKVIEMFKNIKAQYPEIIFADPKRIQCPNNRCIATLNSIPIFGYNTHINDYASSVFGVHYLEKYGNPFKKN